MPPRDTRVTQMAAEGCQGALECQPQRWRRGPHARRSHGQPLGCGRWSDGSEECRGVRRATISEIEVSRLEASRLNHLKRASDKKRTLIRQNAKAFELRSLLKAAVRTVQGQCPLSKPRKSRNSRLAWHDLNLRAGTSAKLSPAALMKIPFRPLSPAAGGQVPIRTLERSLVLLEVRDFQEVWED